MDPPTSTAQLKQLDTRGDKPRFYEPPAVAEARAKLTANLAPHSPSAPLEGALRLTTKWLFPLVRGRADGEYKSTKPDTDNLQKLLKDVMTHCRFWQDDAQVASEITEKFWSQTTGIFIRVEHLP
jgi:Holliday junction resolvase RusA-like endonuclease